MTKKDFQALARALHLAMPLIDAEPYNRKNTWLRCVKYVADVCAASNPRFDRARFIEACETGKTKGMPR